MNRRVIYKTLWLVSARDERQKAAVQSEDAAAGVAWPHLRTSEDSVATPMTTRYAYAIGERRTISLPDGSDVTLDTDSAISLPRWSTETGGRRLHSRSSEGRPCSRWRRIEAHPFVVTNAGRSVEALGTTFMVRAEGPRFSVALLEGKVAVDIAAADNSRRAILQPGDTLVQERNAVTLAHGKAADMANWAARAAELRCRAAAPDRRGDEPLFDAQDRACRRGAGRAAVQRHLLDRWRRGAGRGAGSLPDRARHPDRRQQDRDRRTLI